MVFDRLGGNCSPRSVSRPTSVRRDLQKPVLLTLFQDLIMSVPHSCLLGLPNIWERNLLQEFARVSGSMVAAKRANVNALSIFAAKTRQSSLREVRKVMTNRGGDVKTPKWCICLFFTRKALHLISIFCLEFLARPYERLVPNLKL